MMTRAIVLLTICFVTATTACAGISSDVSDLLNHCTANLDQLDSWVIKGAIYYETQRDSRKDPNMVRHFKLCSDGTRTYAEHRLWSTYKVDAKAYERAEDNCLCLVWDGKLYKKYTKGKRDDSGTAYFDDFTSGPSDLKDYEIGLLRYGHEACFATGYAFNSFDRIDKLLREAKTVSLRKDTELINGIACHVIDAETAYGDLTVWLDPNHGYAIAKHHIEARREVGQSKLDRHIIWEALWGLWRLRLCALLGRL